MSDQSTSATDGSVGVFPGEAGLVGTPNARGTWAMWIPRPGVRYDATYWGRSLSVQNNGDGTYSLTIGGATRTHSYAYRWTTSPFYDASGNPIASQSAAAQTGDPDSAFFQPGYTSSSGAAPAVVQPAATVVQATPVQTSGGSTVTTQSRASGAPDPANTRTQSSDGRRDVYAGDSGLVGIFDAGRDAWYIFMPPVGVDYASVYWGGDIALRNNGDGTYWLDADGVRALRLYAQRWQRGTFYDRNGMQVSSPAQATARGDPADIFFMPGQIAPSTASAPGVSTAPTTPQPRLPVDPLPPASTYMSTGPTGTGSTGPVYTSGGFVPTGGGVVEVPQVDPFGPPQQDTGNGKLIALAAVAAFALLS